MSFNRRVFLQSAAAFTAAAGPLRTLNIPAVDAREPLRQLDYAHVQLTTGPFATQYNDLHAHYLVIPQQFRTEPINDLNPNNVAILRGPAQYVAFTPPEHLSDDRLTLPSALKHIEPGAFTEDYQGRQIIFVPLHQVQNQTYTSYFTKA